MSQWLTSGVARKLLLYSSWAVVCMGFFMIFMLTPWFTQIEALPRGELTLRVLGGALGIVGAPASIIIWFGMVASCIFEGRSSGSVKVLWFLLFFTTAMFGAAVYFFKVYTKQVGGPPLGTS
jgi:hypothetical protein